MILVRSNPQFSNNISNLNFKNYEKIHFVDLENIVGRKPLRSENYFEKMFYEFDKYCQNHVDFEKDFLFVAANYFIINQLRLRYDSQPDNLYLIPINGKDGADKLLQLKLDVGDLGERIVFAGIKKSYKPDELINKMVILVNNLAPRKMKFGISEGMVLASSNDDDIFLISPDTGATPGLKVK